MIFSIVLASYSSVAQAAPKKDKAKAEVKVDDKKQDCRKPYTEAEIEKMDDAVKIIHALRANEEHKLVRMGNLRKDVAAIQKDLKTVYSDMSKVTAQIQLMNKDGDVIARLDIINGKLVKTTKLLKQAEIEVRKAQCQACQLLCKLDELHDAITIGNIISFGAGFGLGFATGGSTVIAGRAGNIFAGPVPIGP